MNKPQDINTKIFTFPLDDMINSIIDSVTFCRGGRSSVGRALGCDPSRRGFESRRSPHFLLIINVLKKYYLATIVGLSLRPHWLHDPSYTATFSTPKRLSANDKAHAVTPLPQVVI